MIARLFSREFLSLMQKKNVKKKKKTEKSVFLPASPLTNYQIGLFVVLSWCPVCLKLKWSSMGKRILVDVFHVAEMSC